MKSKALSLGLYRRYRSGRHSAHSRGQALRRTGILVIVENVVGASGNVAGDLADILVCVDQRIPGGLDLEGGASAKCAPERQSRSA